VAFGDDIIMMSSLRSKSLHSISCRCCAYSFQLGPGVRKSLTACPLQCTLLVHLSGRDTALPPEAKLHCSIVPFPAPLPDRRSSLPAPEGRCFVLLHTGTAPKGGRSSEGSCLSGTSGWRWAFRILCMPHPGRLQVKLFGTHIGLV
jgi:hypothetical protein